MTTQMTPKQKLIKLLCDAGYQRISSKPIIEIWSKEENVMILIYDVIYDFWSIIISYESNPNSRSP